MAGVATTKECRKCGAAFKVRAGAAGHAVHCIPCRKPTGAAAPAGPEAEYLARVAAMKCSRCGGTRATGHVAPCS